VQVIDDIISISSFQEKKPVKKRKSINAKLRYEILHRDNFKCKRCGDSPAINNKCVLHIDHIKPHSKGGSSNKNNLQTLCRSCNQGKGNRYNE
jgi:5-methylcytosine-specific restriction endonuclease McrA